MNTRIQARRTKRAQRDREGVVLVITALVLMIVSATAVFAMQQGLFEVKAEGQARVALRNKYCADGVAMAALSGLEQNDFLELELSEGGDVYRDEWGLPHRDPNATDPETVYEIREGQIAASSATPVACDEGELAGASIYDANYFATVEVAELKKGTKTHPQNTVRYTVTSYTKFVMPGENVVTGEQRGAHGTIGISRAFYTKR